MPDKKRINKILEILKISELPYEFIGSYNNPDFEYFSDIDLDQNININKDTPLQLKKLLERIKKYGPKLKFSLLELKFGINKKEYFRSGRVQDYNLKYNKNFEDIHEAKAFVKERYTNRIFDVNASLEEIESKFIKPKIIKLDILVEDEPNFTIEIFYKFKPRESDIIESLLFDIEKQSFKNRWDKVAKRLYSIAKLLKDDSRKKKILDILTPYLKDIWLHKSLDIPQSQKWVNYVKSLNINFDQILDELKHKLINNLLI